MLSDTPRQKLAAMIALDGPKVASDAKLCEALLRDYCGEYRLEIAALTAAVRWGIPKGLSEAGLVPPATVRANLARRLQENHGLAEESAFWAVDAWASVLGRPSSEMPASGATMNTDAEATAAWSALAGPVSPPPLQSPLPKPPAPRLPALPATPFETQQSLVPPPQSPPTPQWQSPARLQSPAQPQWQPPPPPQSPPLPRVPYQAQSPVLPPLPKPPSEPHSPPPPRPPYQAQSPILPPLPKPSEPQPPPLPKAQYQSQSPLPQPQPTALEFVPAARAFENRQITTQLRLVETYLKMELKTRKPAALLEELQVAGIQPLTAKRLVAQALRGAAVQHFWIALAIFAACLLLKSAASSFARFDSQTAVGSQVLFVAAGVYLVYRGVRLIGTF